MSAPWRNLVKEIRYFFFPVARVIDQRTMQLDEERQQFKKKKAQTDHIVKNANKPDILRNLVISMTEDRHSG